MRLRYPTIDMHKGARSAFCGFLSRQSHVSNPAGWANVSGVLAGIYGRIHESGRICIYERCLSRESPGH